MRVPYTCDCGGMLDSLKGNDSWRCNRCGSTFTGAYFASTNRCTCPLCHPLDSAAQDVQEQGDQGQDQHDDDEDAGGTPDVDAGVSQDGRKHVGALPPFGGT